MVKDVKDWGLDLHCTMILEEYRECAPAFARMKEIVLGEIARIIKDSGLFISGYEGRVKQEASLAGKLELKGSKYRTLSDITDILGVRIITFYNEDVDKVASLVEKSFSVDWNESVDKRKLHDLNSFGYDSLHYICRIPEKLFHDPEMPQLNELRFEIQMRTILQHAWATIDHDTGYKSGVEIPREYVRALNRLSGVLELADEQFSNIRTSINDYRRKVQALVADGRFDQVLLDGETFRSYLELDPFSRLLSKIAKINQAEIYKASSLPYLQVLKDLGFNTLADVENLRKECSDDAYSLALKQLGGTDIDIIASNVAIQDLITVFILRRGGGINELEKMYETLNGPSEYNAVRATQVFNTASSLQFMHSK